VGIASSSNAMEGYSANPFPTPGIAILSALGVVVKKGCAKRNAFVFSAGSVFSIMV
jgi:hypothetical protein